MVQILEHRLLHQIGMHRRNAVDAMRSDERQLPHPHPAARLLVDQRYRGPEIDIAGTPRIRDGQMLDIDAIDDVEMARQQPFEQLNRPGLERLRQQRVVGVGQGGHGDLPRFVPVEVVKIAENAHQLGDGETGMGVVELHRGL